MHNDPRPYFALLRHALGLCDVSALDHEWLRHADWAAVLRFARKQALVGVLFEGIKQLPADLSPKGTVLLEWVAQSEATRRQSLLLDRATAHIYNMVRARGHACAILKGQGNALLYPVPSARTPGDVDVWVGPTPVSREQLYEVALSLAGGDASRLNVSYYHISLNVKGIEVELHPTPAVLASPRHNRRLQRWLAAEAQAQMAHTVELHGAGSVAVPTRAFNLVYQLLHLYHHYFYEGIGLRQFVDYMLLLTEARDFSSKDLGGTGDEKERIVSTLRQLGLLGFCGAVMWVLGEVFALPAERMLVKADERRGRMLLHDILRGGNFGHHDHRFAHNAIGHNLQRLQRDLLNLRYYPHEALAEPWFRLWHFFWRKRH